MIYIPELFTDEQRAHILIYGSEYDSDEIVYIDYDAAQLAQWR